ncbi:hypothetical protein CBL_00128 [Carabus blaptoides fortunei]
MCEQLLSQTPVSTGVQHLSSDLSFDITAADPCVQNGYLVQNTASTQCGYDVTHLEMSSSHRDSRGIVFLFGSPWIYLTVRSSCTFRPLWEWNVTGMEPGLVYAQTGGNF